MTRLVHLANFNSTNIGNGALIFGSERVVREDWHSEVSFIPEAWDDYTFGVKKFDANIVSQVNREDGLLIGAAVAINGRDYLSNAGMRFDIPFSMWPSFSKPIVFYGISYRVWPQQRYHHLDQFKLAMNYILQSPQIMFSVRNDGTKTWLESLLGFESEKIDTIPDPAMYVPTSNSWHPELREDKVNIIVSLNNEDETYRFGGELRERIWREAGPDADEKQLLAMMKKNDEWRERKQNCLKRLAQALEMLSRDWDLNIILCPHYFDDYKIMSEFIALFPPRLAHQKTVSCGLLKVDRTPYFYDLYAKADVAISMRVHSITPSVGLGTPVLALSTQERISEFMKSVGLQEFLIDFFDSDLTQQVYAKVSNILNTRQEVRKRLEAVRSRMREQTRSYHHKMEAFVSSGFN